MSDHHQGLTIEIVDAMLALWGAWLDEGVGSGSVHPLARLMKSEHLPRYTVGDPDEVWEVEQALAYMRETAPGWAHAYAVEVQYRRPDDPVEWRVALLGRLLRRRGLIGRALRVKNRDDYYRRVNAAKVAVMDALIRVRRGLIRQTA